MFLSKLEISRGACYEKHHGELRGKAEFENAEGHKIEIPFDDQFSKEIVKLCADALVRSAKGAADNMVAEIITDNPHAAIEDLSTEGNPT